MSKNIEVIFKAQDDEFKKSLKETNQQIKLTKSQLQETGAKLNAYGNNIKTLGEKHNLLKKQIENVTEKMKKYQDNITKNTDKLNTNKKALEELSRKKTELKAKYDEAVKTYGKESQEAIQLKAELEKLSNEYKEMENKVKSNTNALNNNMTNLNKTKAQYTELQAELSKTNKAISEQSNRFIQASKKFESLGSKFKSVGGNISDVGGSLMKLSAPIVAVSAGAIKVGADFEESMSQVRATCAPTQEEFEKLRQKSIDLGRDIKGASSKEVADSFNYLAMAGYDANQMLDAIEPNVKASIAMNIDMATSSDLCTDAMSTMNLTADQTGHFLDVVAQTSRKANTNGQQMMEAYIGCGGMFRELNVPLQESATLLGTLANQGIKGSEAGTSLNAILINLMGNSGQAKQALASLNMSAYDSQGKFKGVTNVLNELKGKLSNCTEKQRQMFESFIGGKTQIDTLSALLNCLGDNYNSLYSDIGECDGAVEEMYQTMTDNTKGSWTEFQDELEAVGIELADDLLPVCNDLLDIGKEFVEWFGSLDEGTRKMIVQTGLLTFATGGLLKSIGSTTKGIGAMLNGGSKLLGWLGKITGSAKTASTATEAVGGAMKVAEAGSAGLSAGLSALSGVAVPLIGIIGTAVGAYYACSEAEDVMNRGISQSIDEMNGMQQVMAELMGVQRYSKEELQEMGIVYKDFAEGTSQETQQSLDDMAGKFRDLQATIDDISLNNMITDNDVTTITNKANEMCSNIVNAIDNHKDEGYQAMYNLFMQDGAIDEAEKTMLDQLSVNQNNMKAEVQKGKDEINAIYKKASQEHRDITEEEGQQIKEIQDKWQQISLEALTQSEEEKERNAEAFYQRASSLSQEEMSQMLQTEIKNHDDSIQAIKDKYDTAISVMEEAIPKMEGKAKEEAEARLEQYKQAEQTELQNENDTYNKKLAIMDERQPEVMATINKYNGQELSEYDKQSQEVLSKLQDHYTNMDNITESGTQLMYNKISGTWDAVTIKVDEDSGKIIGIFDNTTGQVGAYSQDIANSMKETADATDQATAESEGALNSLSGCMVNVDGTVTNSAGNIVGKLTDVETESGKVKSGVLDLNGTPIRINCDADGAISDLDDVNGKINKVHDKSFTITGFFKSVGEGIKDFFGFANGGTVGESGVYNVNERGVELFDNLTQTAGYSLTANTGYEKAYLNSGTKVTNAMMTTQKMKRMVEEETDNKTAQVVSKLLNNFRNKENNDNYDNRNPIVLQQTNIVKLNNKVIAKETTEEVIKNIDRKAKNGGA